MTRTRALIAAAGMLAAACVSAEEIPTEGLLVLPDADVVILGEIHDNPIHHAHQTLAVQALGPRAIVFEMLTDAEARRITPALVGDERALESALGWRAKGWPDFAWYYPIFAAAPDAAFFGADLGSDIVRRAVREGAAPVLGGSAALFGLDRPLSEDEQTRREAEQASAHCNALPDTLLPGMVEAQRLRDAALARAVIAAQAETGGPVAVITGNGHARRDWGVPAMLARGAIGLSVLTVAQYEDAAPADPPFDLWLVTPAAPREDPCATFRR